MILVMLDTDMPFLLNYELDCLLDVLTKSECDHITCSNVVCIVYIKRFGYKLTSRWRKDTKAETFIFHLRLIVLNAYTNKTMYSVNKLLGGQREREVSLQNENEMRLN